MRQAKHKCDTHQVDIDLDTVNNAGLPAIVCAECITKKGPRKGKPKFICWINTRDYCKMQYGDKWEIKYTEMMSEMQQQNTEQAQDHYTNADTPGNYTAYT
tara:strand:+ start:1971 stop:2273 length:303 start_codon:yes stop_codon:yes gene_type:complete